MTVFHDSQDIKYRKPFGAVAAGDTVALKIYAEEATSCTLFLKHEGGETEYIPMERELETQNSFAVTVKTSSKGTLLWYFFALKNEKGESFFYGNNDEALGGVGLLKNFEPTSYQITVYEKTASPEWFKNSIAYQIFPDRFYRGRDYKRRQNDSIRPSEWRGSSRMFIDNWDDKPFYIKNEKGEVTSWPFFGGTLEGVREKLLYLKSLGVGAIYLNPIFEANSNHKYDTADYTKIDPGFGDEESFKALAAEASKLGISLILDGVFSHTGADSIYFNKYSNYGSNGACQGKDSPYFDWYYFERFPDLYDSWWGVKDLPKLNKQNPVLREFIYGTENSVVRRWLKLGARGWRLDVADELPDDFISGIREAMTEEKPDSLLLGEVWEDASNKVSYGERRKYFLGKELDNVMNYPFRECATDFMLGRLSAYGFARRMMNLKENYPPENFYMALNLIGSHDRVRALTLLGDAPDSISDEQKKDYVLPPDKYGLALQRLKILSLIQFSFAGVPCIFYGDEAGLQGFEDPYNRAPFPWGKENMELTEHYRIISQLRNQHKAFVSGDLTLEGLTEHVLAVKRCSEKEELMLLVNRGIFEHESVTLDINAGYVLDLLTSEELHPADGKLTLNFEPLSARLLCFKKAPPEKTRLQRAAGILCHLSSIPTERGKLSVGDTFAFIDFLAESGQKLWQILPLNPVGEGFSPFFSPSLFALGEHFESTETISPEGFEEFCAENDFWLSDYALYMTFKDKNSGKPWQEWPENERLRQNLDVISKEHEAFILNLKLSQYKQQLHWDTVKTYAASRGVSIIGDLPIYPAPDSADVWANKELFYLNERGYPSLHAGVPPDYFCPEGQNWQNPLYDWGNSKEGLYLFWEARLKRALKCYDYVRLDHFRSFSAYFAIPENAKPSDGYWLCGAGAELFDEIRSRLGSLNLIAEDLGVQDTGVENLLKLTGLPGMKVWQFSASEMENKTENRIFYSGTHDNQTLVGWLKDNFPEKDALTEAEEITKKLYSSGAPWVILPLQDVLKLSDEARMNTPGTCTGNWKWKYKKEKLAKTLAQKLYNFAKENRR